MKEHIVNQGVYIPNTGITYPEQPDAFLLQPEIIYPTDLENNYPFVDNRFSQKLLRFGIYLGIFTIVFPLQRIRYGLKIEGKKNLRKNRKYLKNGAMTICNHVYRWDILCVIQAVKHRLWFPVRDLNVMTSDRNFVRGAGGIPIPKTLSATRHFNQAFDKLREKKHWLHIFPEASRWEWYEPIRPFKIGAFKMAYRYEIPVIPCVISYREPKGLYKLFKVKHPLVTLHVGEPILPEKREDESRNEACARIRAEAHQQMVKMAGIQQNMWPCEGD